MTCPARRWYCPARAAIDAEVVQLHLRLGPSERGGTFECADVVVLVDQIEHILARGGDHGPEIDARRRARGYSHAAAQGEDRVEHRPGRAGKRAAINRRDGRANAASSAEKPRTIGFELALAHGLRRQRPPGVRPRPAAP